MAQFKVTAPHVISLPDGTDAAPGQIVTCDDTDALIALGHLTPIPEPPAPKSVPKTAPPSTRDVVAEPAPDKE